MDGVYSITYFGFLGGGIGVMRAKRLENGHFGIIGHDMLNTKYSGIMCVDPASEEITLNFEMEVQSNVILVQGTSPHELKTKKTNLVAKFPPRFESAAPVKCYISPGEVYVGIRRITDTFEKFAVDGFPKQLLRLFYGW